MKIKTNEDKRKIIIISCLLFVIITSIIVVSVILIKDILRNNTNYSKYNFKQDIIVENVNQKINIKDLLSNNDIDSSEIIINSKNSDIVSVENNFISLNKTGATKVSVTIKNHIDSALFLIVNDKTDISKIQEHLYFESDFNNIITLNEEVDLSLAGELSEFASLTFSNSNLRYNKDAKTILGVGEGKTTITATISYQTLNSLKPINICTSIDMYVESDIDSFNIKILDEDFVEKDTIRYNSQEEKINGYFLIENAKYLASDNISINLRDCECLTPIIYDGKYLIPFKLKNWGIVKGNISYNGKQGSFLEEISFTSLNEVYTELPSDIVLQTEVNDDSVVCRVLVYFGSDIKSIPFNVLFICDDVETKYNETDYISNFEIDANIIMFSVKTPKTFRLKVVLNNIPTMSREVLVEII